MPIPEGDGGCGLGLDCDHGGSEMILATPLLAVQTKMLLR